MYQKKCSTIKVCRRWKKIKMQRYTTWNGEHIVKWSSLFYSNGNRCIWLHPCSMHTMPNAIPEHKIVHARAVALFFRRFSVSTHYILCMYTSMLFTCLFAVFFSMSNPLQLKFTRTQNANQRAYVAYLTPWDCTLGWVWIKKKRFNGEKIGRKKFRRKT